jgi:PadR family transcriptional regulator, regulatory protein PadR
MRASALHVLRVSTKRNLLTSNTVLYTVYAIHYMSPSTDTTSDDRFENLRQELRRGSLPLAVLAALRTEHYGYTLRKTLADHGMAIDEGTLYPLLRRLETHGLLVSQWREEDKRNKRFYRLSPDGKLILKQLLIEWKSIHTSLEDIFQGKTGA